MSSVLPGTRCAPLPWGTEYWTSGSQCVAQTGLLAKSSSRTSRRSGARRRFSREVDEAAAEARDHPDFTSEPTSGATGPFGSNTAREISSPAMETNGPDGRGAGSGECLPSARSGNVGERERDRTPGASILNRKLLRPRRDSGGGTEVKGDSDG